MKLRILIPTRGSSPWLSATLASAASVPSAEIVLIAPASVPDRLPSQGVACRVVDEGGGLYAALNRGLRAPGEWDVFTWINDDDLLLPVGFCQAVETFHRSADRGLLYGRVRLMNGSGNFIGELPVARDARDLGALLRGGIIPFAQPGTLIRRAVWEQLNGFDETYQLAGDADFFARAIVRGERFGFFPHRTAAFRLWGGQLSKRGDQVARETDRAVSVLSGESSSRAAAWRFRVANLPIYLDRLRRYGWKSMRQIYDLTE